MRTRLNLGQAINTFDPSDALEGEIGTFRAKVPQDCELSLTRNSNGEMYLRWSNPQTGAPQTPFTITKVSEPATSHEGVTPITKAG